MRTKPTLASALRRLVRSEGGGMAVMGAVVALPLCVVGFAAVEYHQLTMARTELQNAVDAATLAAARSGKNDNAALKAVGLPVLKGYLKQGRAHRKLKDGDVSFTKGSAEITGSARVCVNPIVSGMIGIDETCLTATSQVKREDMALEVVLVLDSSGSMETWSPSAGMKRVDAMEAAAKSFIDKLQGLDDPTLPDDVRIGLVPYAGSVKLSSSYRGQGWLDSAGASSVNRNLFYSSATMAAVNRPRRFDLFDAMGISWRGCVESRPGDYAMSDAPPDAAAPDSLFVPYFAPDELDRKTTPWFIQGTAYPNNYLSDGTDGLIVPQQAYVYENYWKELQYAVEKYTRAAVDASGLDRNSTDKGPNRWCKTDRVRPLTNDWSALKSSLDVIPTARHTNIPLGLMWGWHVLSPNAPFADGKPYAGAGVTKVLVLLTDGHSYMDPPGPMEGEDPPNKNQSYYNSLGYIWRGRLGLAPASSHTQILSALNTQMQTICSRMKAKGVQLYTIQLEAGIAANQELIACSGADNFKNAVNASELNGVFQKIADEVLNLRLAR